MQGLLWSHSNMSSYLALPTWHHLNSHLFQHTNIMVKKVKLTHLKILERIDILWGEVDVELSHSCVSFSQSFHTFINVLSCVKNPPINSCSPPHQLDRLFHTVFYGSRTFINSNMNNFTTDFFFYSTYA